ncbi:hypothetical protein Tco_1414271, partial [Tanacetum coccineum]
VNAQQGDHVDEVMLISKTSEEECNQEFDAIFQDYEDIQSMLFDDYKTLQMELTIDHGAVDTVRLFNEFGQELDGEHNQKVSMEIAKLALWYDSCRDSGFSDVKAFENSLKITGFSKEKEDVGEICVICNEEYKVGEMTATMECEEHLFSRNKLHAILINSLLSLLALVIFASRTENQDAIDALELLLILKSFTGIKTIALYMINMPLLRRLNTLHLTDFALPLMNFLLDAIC